MALIEIQEGLILETSNIEGLEKIDGNNTKIYTHHRKYLAKMPIETVTAILKGGEMETRNMSSEDSVKNTMEKLDKVLNNVGHFAG